MKDAKDNDDLLKIIEARKTKGHLASEDQAPEAAPDDELK
jgi:hypothetical protein